MNHYRTADTGGHRVFYREAGTPGNPAPRNPYVPPPVNPYAPPPANPYVPGTPVPGPTPSPSP